MTKAEKKKCCFSFKTFIAAYRARWAKILRHARVQFGHCLGCSCGTHVDLHDDLKFAKNDEPMVFDLKMDRLYHEIDFDQSNDLSQGEYEHFVRLFVRYAVWQEN